MAHIRKKKRFCLSSCLRCIHGFKQLFTLGFLLADVADKPHEKVLALPQFCVSDGDLRLKWTFTPPKGNHFMAYTDDV